MEGASNQGPLPEVVHEYGMYSVEGNQAVHRIVEPYLEQVRAKVTSPEVAAEKVLTELTRLKEYFPEATDETVQDTVLSKLKQAG